MKTDSVSEVLYASTPEGWTVWMAFLPDKPTDRFRLEVRAEDGRILARANGTIGTSKRDLAALSDALLKLAHLGVRQPEASHRGNVR